MPQRRSVAKSPEHQGKTMVTVNMEEDEAAPPPQKQAVRAPLQLEPPPRADETEEETVPLAETPDPERRKLERHTARVRKWKESPFACGLTEPSWREEWLREADKRLLPPDETGCLCCSALVCAWLGAERVGNMAVLRQSREWVEEVEVDEETGEETVARRYLRPRLDVVIGPYWPMLVFVTYGLIFGISIWTFHTRIWGKGQPPVLVFVWCGATLGLMAALAMTACRDPGILYRTRDEPPDGTWRWSDQADSYRPRHAWFDADTAVVVEGFDHT